MSHEWPLSKFTACVALRDVLQGWGRALAWELSGAFSKLLFYKN